MQIMKSTIPLHTMECVSKTIRELFPHLVMDFEIKSAPNNSKQRTDFSGNGTQAFICIRTPQTLVDCREYFEHFVHTAVRPPATLIILRPIAHSLGTCSLLSTTISFFPFLFLSPQQQLMIRLLASSRLSRTTAHYHIEFGPR